MPDFIDHEVQIMEAIRKRWGAAIAAACAASTVRPDFLAALIANESGGDPNARRFEPAVFGKLLEVCAGKRADYHPSGIKKPLGALDLLSYVIQPNSGHAPDAAQDFQFALRKMADLATSWGLTQIMAWHCIEFERNAISDGQDQLQFTVFLLAYFAQKYQLALGTDDEALLRCWNTGRPDGQTYDPQYVAKAQRRMKIYLALG